MSFYLIFSLFLVIWFYRNYELSEGREINTFLLALGLIGFYLLLQWWYYHLWQE